MASSTGCPLAQGPARFCERRAWEEHLQHRGQGQSQGPLATPGEVTGVAGIREGTGTGKSQLLPRVGLHVEEKAGHPHGGH